MKNLRVSLFLLALASLICLFTPCNVLAQESGDDPCCYNSPPIGNPLPNGEIQNGIVLVERAIKSMELIHVQLPANPATMPVTDRLSPVTLAAANNTIVMPGIEESGKLMIYRRQS